MPHGKFYSLWFSERVGPGEFLKKFITLQFSHILFDSLHPDKPSHETKKTATTATSPCPSNVLDPYPVTFSGMMRPRSMTTISDDVDLEKGDICGSRFMPKLEQIDPKMGLIRDFFRSNFSTFWLGELKCADIWSEKGMLGKRFDTFCWMLTK